MTDERDLVYLGPAFPDVPSLEQRNEEKLKALLERMAPGVSFAPQPGRVHESVRCQVCDSPAVETVGGRLEFTRCNAAKHSARGPQQIVEEVPPPRRVQEEEEDLFGHSRSRKQPFNHYRD